ncbi:hypothetical protein AZE42_07317 [Rhizopogon vesiculosus]|uniref:Ubiquitin-like protease family profile domain-containing protein n=1 Tax=Rhizopogon vesiculosus TaxID=180088 RepID=A0A1J8R903_9AGAM|nr:hypothetical protein AZE42_07317 [Rhizopogon vesiculosus]
MDQVVSSTQNLQQNNHTDIDATISPVPEHPPSHMNNGGRPEMLNDYRHRMATTYCDLEEGEEDEEEEIMRLINKFYIQDGMPHASQAALPLQLIANDVPYDRLEREDVNEQLGVNEDEDEDEDDMKERMKQQGMPRSKTTINYRSNQPTESATLDVQSLTQVTQTHGTKQILDASINPVPNRPTPRTDINDAMDYIGIHTQYEEWNNDEDDVDDEELMLALLKTGILDLRTSKFKVTCDNSDGQNDTNKGVDNQLMLKAANDDSKGNKGKWTRPRIKFITHRLPNISGVKCIIHATRSPVAEDPTAKVNILPTSGIIKRGIHTNAKVPHKQDAGQDSDFKGKHVGIGQLQIHESKKRGRGRPKKHSQVTVNREVPDEPEAHVNNHIDGFKGDRLENNESDNEGEHDSPEESQDYDYRPTPPPQLGVQSPSIQDISRECPEPMIEDIASRAMARPIIWVDAWLNCTSLGEKQWLEATVANFYLSHVWYEARGRSLIRYMDIYAAMATTMDDEELEIIRRYHLIPNGDACPVVPVGFIVHHSQHFFAVIFDYLRSTAHVLGRNISGNILDVDGVHQDNWEDWRGPEYWRKIAAFHGWRAGDITDVFIQNRDWPQNGYDCGPIACSILEQALYSGLDQDGNVPSFQVQCGHRLRIHMLRVVAGRIMRSCTDFLMLLDRPHDTWPVEELPDNNIIRSIQSGLHEAECLRLVRTLSVISATCIQCRESLPIQYLAVVPHQQGNDNGLSEDGSDGEENQETLEVLSADMKGAAPNEEAMGALSIDRKATLSKLFKENKELSGSRNRNTIVPRAVGTHLMFQPKSSKEVNTTGDSQRSKAAVATRRRVLNWGLGSTKRYPRPTAPVPLSAYKGKRWLLHDPNFDDYEGGPTIEMMKPDGVESMEMYPGYGRMHMTGWKDWVDHGFRTSPGGFHIFYQCDPIATMDHIMPIGTWDSYDASMQVPDCVTGAYSLQRLGSDDLETPVHVSDVQIISASDMIDAAPYDPPLDEECRHGHNSFVRGYTSQRYGDGTPIYLDLEEDAIKFSPQEITISVDIDSLIWTTKVFRCRGTVGIYLTPPFQTKPGIFKHNHTYIDIIIPQSAEDASNPGGRTEWLSKRFPMSAIPHVCIGRISSASSTLNLYIMFPRMIHRHPTNGRRITLMPQDVIDIFWDRVLLPSIGDCTDVSWAPYLKHSLSEVRYKAGGAGGSSGGWRSPKTIPLSNDDFRDVQHRMNELVHAGNRELSMYGSSFFVLEGKGIKLLTKDGQRGRFTGPEEALLSNLPDLDWPYMMDRTFGELLVDVGISFTPHSSDVPVIGLWRLDALEASFGAGGYKRGDIHHHNTLSRYGALQAEMQQERSQQTHIAFRSTYNLYYEAIRTNSNEVNFASDSDAYKLSPSYMAECFQIVKLMEGCKGKTYGVRDEYRVSGKAARIMLENIPTKAEEYLQSDPILWIPANSWFELLRRRIREIQRTQISIVRKNPPNLGILTGVLNHMLRSTTSTPIAYDHHVRESLALLQFRNVLETAGIFFLHDFNISSDTCLDEVQQVDDMHVLAIMGINSKAQRDKAVGRMEGWGSADSDSDDYPIGRMPTWNRLKAVIASTPAMIMRPWIWPSSLNDSEMSMGRLFIMFTRQIWLMLTEEVLKGIRPYPNSLQEAMKCWTITSVDDTLAAVAFDACNSGLHDNTGITPGRMGPRSRSFANRCSIFFPHSNAPHKDKDPWSALRIGDGYIAEFHRMMEKMDENQQTSLQEGLCEVFSYLHCLPASGSNALEKEKPGRTKCDEHVAQGS